MGHSTEYGEVTTRAGNAAYRVKVSLDDVRPSIWRRIEVLGDTKLDRFSRLLLAAMGWSNTHLHVFLTTDGAYGPIDRRFPGDMRDERRLTLRQVLSREIPAFGFVYDFGDGWFHRVVQEAVAPARADVAYPRCLAGRRACPPENVGGPGGYGRMLAALADPYNPEHVSFATWLGRPFDATRFDLAETNAALQNCQ